MSRVFYVNGDFVPEEKAVVSVLDRGFLFADAVYEVTTVLEGKLIDNDAHLARLARSLSELQMRSPLSNKDLVAAQRKLVELNALDQGGLYLQVTRGVADRDFAFPSEDTVPGIVMFTQEKNLLDDPYAKSGIKVISVKDIRWKRRDIKTVGLLGPSMAKQQAVEGGANDAWLVEEGFVTEGSSNNAYIVRNDGSIQTRQLGSEILSGITRKAVLRLCEQTGQKVIEKPFTVEDVKAADEAFVTSATTFVMPVVNIDGRAIGDGKPGPVALQLRKLYIELAHAQR